MSFSSDRKFNILVERYEDFYELWLNRLKDNFDLSQDDWGQGLIAELESLLGRIRRNIRLSYEAERISGDLIQEGERNIERFFQEINRRLNVIKQSQTRISPAKFIQEILKRLCPIFPIC